MHALSKHELLKFHHPNLWKAIHQGTLTEGGSEFEKAAKEYPLH
tara:strand:+ start:2428 stop:2559 length:132 start_codon:yes stop_codon:yes gene_type:complete